MTFKVAWWVACDGRNHQTGETCDAQAPRDLPGGSLTETRKIARRAGWVTTRHGHFCAFCKRKRAS